MDVLFHAQFGDRLVTHRNVRRPSYVKFRLRMFSGGGPTFVDRRQAGEQLGAVLRTKLGTELGAQQQLVVFGLVRGGLPVAEPVAEALGGPLDAFVVRKIGAPLQPEFGIGAISEGGHTIINKHAARAVGASVQQLQHIIEQESAELLRRIEVYRGGQDHLPVAGKTVVVVDDGLATGVTAKAALQSLRAKGAARLLLAVPVGSSGTVADIAEAQLADEVMCLSQPKHFRAVGQWYDDFNQTTDDEVVAILNNFEARNAAFRSAAAAPAAAMAAAAAAAATAAGSSPVPVTASPGKASAAATHMGAKQGLSPAGPADTGPPRDQFTPPPATAATAATAATTPAAAAAAAAAAMQPTTEEELVITDAATPGVRLHGTLNVPQAAKGLVIFAHGSGSSRHSPRNRQVAATLNKAGFATLLFDLLSVSEAENRANVFDIPLLASRLQLAVEWMEVTGKLPRAFPVGFFGASTGGGAALWAAAYLDDRVSAVVVRGGRPDLAAQKLPAVTAPTLLLVGAADLHVLDLNTAALQLLGSAADSDLAVVPHAGHLFEGPGQLEDVADRAAEWFMQHMVQRL